MRHLLPSSRLCAAAQPDHICVSGVIHDACDDPTAFVDTGPHVFKGFSEPVRVFEVARR